MITITIRTENAAFGPDPWDRHAEIARILRELANQIVDGGIRSPMDFDGNKIGTVERTGKDRDL